MAYINEKKGEDLKEGRSIVISAGTIPLSAPTGRDIPAGYPEGSNLSDMAKPVNLSGGNGNTYKAPFVKTAPEGKYTDEGDTPETTEPEFGFRAISGSKITAYGQISRDARKLPAAAYAETVESEMQAALRRKISKEMINGEGSVKGIYKSDVVKEIKIKALDKDTIDGIIYNLARPEGCEGSAILILSLEDIKALATLRNATTGEKEYAVTFDGVRGKINGVDFIVNSAVNSLTTAADTDKTMIYGWLKGYQVVYFTDAETRRSDGEGFKTGIDAFLADVVAGGDVVIPESLAVITAHLKAHLSYDWNTDQEVTGTLPDETTADFGGTETVTIPSPDPTYEKHVWAAWNTEADGSGTGYTTAADITMADDVRLYAQWHELFDIEYDWDCDPEEVTGTLPTHAPVEEGSSFYVVIPDPAPTREGYTFAGWSDTQGAAEAKWASKTSVTPTADMHIYAVWTPAE